MTDIKLYGDVYQHYTGDDIVGYLAEGKYSKYPRVKKDITKHNVDLMRKYARWLKVHKNVKDQTIYHHIEAIIVKADGLKKGFDKFTKEDVEQWVEELETWRRRRLKKDCTITIREGRRSEASKAMHKTVIRIFFQFLRGTERGSMPPEVSWITVRAKTLKARKLPEDMPVWEDVIKIIEKAQNPRDRAIISMLFEGALRVGCEAMTMHIRNVKAGMDGIYLLVPQEGKTGQRRVVLSECKPYLLNWLNHHPDRSKPDAPLFPILHKNGRGRPMPYGSVYQMIKKCVKAAGVQKKISPYVFRHGGITQLVRERASESAIRKYVGWVGDSKMIDVYAHLSQTEVDEQILKARGREPVKKASRKPIIIKCANCGAENPPNTGFCMLCGLPPGDEKLAKDIASQKFRASVLDAIKSDPQLMEGIVKIYTDKLEAEGATAKKPRPDKPDGRPDD